MSFSNFSKIDWVTVSLGQHKTHKEYSTMFVLDEFASILPMAYKNTCRDMVISNGGLMRASQYGISVTLQYGSALSRGWVYSVALSGKYLHAIKRDKQVIKKIFELFEGWRISRLDLCHDVLVPLEDWQKYSKVAFENGCFIVGSDNALTISCNSRRSQFYTRIYNKSAEDAKHYHAPDGEAQIRFEVEIHRVKGERVLQQAFEETDFADKLLLQRIRKISKNDSTGFIAHYFDNDTMFSKIQTVERSTGDFADTVEYIFKKYKPYILAGLLSKTMRKKYKTISLTPKIEKILAVLDHSGGQSYE